MKKLKISLVLILVIPCCCMIPKDLVAQTSDDTNGYIETNGINYYYEIHGEGEPLLLLHGGLGSGEMFYSILPSLTQEHEVITVDLQGHGRTALGNQPLSLVRMGNDMAYILNELGYEQLDVLGYSLGGGVGFQLAVQHPKKVNKLVMIGTVFSRDGYYSGVLKQQQMIGAEMAERMKNTMIYKSYVKLAPHPEDFPKLLDAIGALMAKPFDYSNKVEKLDLPVLLIYGDGGMIKLEHIVEFFHLLGGGLRDAGWTGKYMPINHLAILPNLTHYNIYRSPEMVETALAFLEEGAQIEKK